MQSKNTIFSRGQMAELSGVNGETIRYYESIGLMPDPDRSHGGHRIYRHSQLARLIFIRRSRELGFTIKEVTGLLSLVDDGSYTCAEVRDRTKVHLDDVRQKINDLKKMEKTLQTMVSKCNGGLVPECHIVDSLFSEEFNVHGVAQT